jgi:hypothetical protein
MSPDDLQSLVILIAARGGTISVRQLQRASRRFADASQARAAIQELVEADSATWVNGKVAQLLSVLR